MAADASKKEPTKSPKELATEILMQPTNDIYPDINFSSLLSSTVSGLHTLVIVHPEQVIENYPTLTEIRYPDHKSRDSALERVSDDIRDAVLFNHALMEIALTGKASYRNRAWIEKAFETLGKVQKYLEIKGGMYQENTNAPDTITNAGAAIDAAFNYLSKHEENEEHDPHDVERELENAMKNRKQETARMSEFCTQSLNTIKNEIEPRLRQLAKSLGVELIPPEKGMF